MWIFGYGSLLFKQGFDFVERRTCFIQGYRRLFWQGSSDHRGVPGSPGRVVTLRPFADARCWGAAFQIKSDDRDRVVAALDHREKGGYQRLEVAVFERNATTPFATAVCYVAEPGNSEDLGCAPLPQIAAQVATAVGPSGSNIDYVLQLAEALRAMGVEDRHVFRLDELLRKGAGQQHQALGDQSRS